MFYSCVSARTVLTTREALILPAPASLRRCRSPAAGCHNHPCCRALEKCGFVPNGKTGEEGPQFCGGTTPNNLSVNSEKVLAGWAAIRQINLLAGKKSNMSAPFCSFTKGREKEYNLNNRHRKYTVRQDRNAQYQLMQGDCHIWRVSCIGSRNGDLP